ncbi:ABC transporter permease [Lactiplantibacillus pentosus]
MNVLIAQLSFDCRRLILRNVAFQFFALMMPAGFYLLFTKAMTGGTTAQMTAFNVAYMGSMTVYSIAINGLFSIAQILMHDREKGLVRWLQLTPHGLVPYYVSIGILGLLMNLLSVAVLGTIAVLVNHVSLTLGQWFGVLGIAIIGQVPIMLIGVALSFLNRAETLSVASNLVTCPMAIMSGLWWPIRMLPDWVQVIGQHLPTFYMNDLLGTWMMHGTLDKTNLFGIGAWTLGLLVVISWGTRRLLKRGNGIVRA